MYGWAPVTESHYDFSVQTDKYPKKGIIQKQAPTDYVYHHLHMFDIHVGSDYDAASIHPIGFHFTMRNWFNEYLL